MTFDSLEDRRLLAGLNIFVYDDANRSGTWESSSESPLAEQVVYLDSDDDGRLGIDEPFAVAGADGKALIDNLSASVALIRLLGSTAPASSVVLPTSDSQVAVDLAGAPPSGNSPPVLLSIPSQTVDEDGELNLASSLFNSAASDSNSDSLFFLVVGTPAHGSLTWSVEAGGSYKPDTDFYGSDSIVVRAYDGKAWSSPVSLEIAVNSIDDLPTAIEFTGSSVPENQLGFVVGAITIVDIDGGPNRIRLTPEDLYEIQDGNLKLVSDRTLNFEESSSSDLAIGVFVGDSESPVLNRLYSLPVTDRNDLPSALVFEGQPRVEEFIAGFEFGTLVVSDEDVGEQYDFLVSDDRFTAVDGKLALKAEAALVYADAATVSVTVTAVSQSTGDQISQTIDIDVVRAAPPWQNRSWALDVNSDGELTPLDVLTVINALNRLGVVPLDRQPPSGSSHFVDVNGDRFLTPLDALILINALNRQSRGLGEGQSNDPESGGGQGGAGEGEASPPPSTQKLAVKPVDNLPMPASDADRSSTAIDDDSLSPVNARKNARRVR